MNTGQKIKAYCKAHGIAIARFAEECGFSHMAVYLWANGKREPTVKSLRMLEAKTGIPLVEWLGDRAA